MNLYLSKVTKAVLSATLCLTPVLVNNQVQAKTEKMESKQKLSNEQLASLTVPILQKYEADDSGKIWKLDQNKNFAILANEDNLQNKRLAEVVKLVNSEIMEKKLLNGNALPMIYLNEDGATQNDILITIDKKKSITTESNSDEAYKIIINDQGVRVIGASENAVLYALRTIEQILVANDGLVYGTIVDYPTVSERRVHVDCGRKYFSKDWFIRQIREMSYFKMNALQMHFSENLGFRIECETDPLIVSDEYLTKDEVREIIAEANKYGVKVIPSFDSPGHVDQILKVHPEYGQVNNKGEHYKRGLDITNQKAIDYIYSLYDEYMELFKGCTDFHIGGDEYMEFDRAPFTTEYQSVLDEYAKKTFGAGYTWKDTVANYINELAEHVHSKGFKPRIWNDGIYYGSSYNPQKIEMHKYIGIDFWSQMPWNHSIAKLDAFVKHGHDSLYNVNCTFFYYVLRNDKPTDGREQHSFDNLNADKKIYNDWTPGNFQANTLDDANPLIKGASLAIWCDKPDLVGEDVVTEDIANEMRAFSSKTWNTRSNSIKGFDEFKADYAKLGHVAGYEKKSQLPNSGEIQSAKDLGKVILKYVDQQGNTIKADDVKYGKIGELYEFKPEKIYGYRVIDETAKKGVYEKEAVYTFVYETYCDKAELEVEIKNALVKNDYIASTYSEYETVLQRAIEIYENSDSRQEEVDQIVKELQNTKGKAVKLEYYPLFVETQYPLENKGYISGYPEYIEKVNIAKEELTQGNLTSERMNELLIQIKDAQKNLVKQSSDTPTVEVAVPAYQTNSANHMVDKDESTKYWSNGEQKEGQNIVFTFANEVELKGIKIVYPKGMGTGGDNLKGADIQISTDNSKWETVGQINETELTKEFKFDVKKTKYVRIHIIKSHNNWLQIAEVYFDVLSKNVDHSLAEMIDNAEKIDITGKTYASVNKFIDALVESQKVNASGSTDIETAKENLQTAIDGLEDRKEVSE